MNKVIVKKGSNSKVSLNFTEDEFHSNSSDAPSSHYVDENVINAWQWLRNRFGVAVRITSTGRTPSHNAAVGGASGSKHMEFDPVVAVDGQFYSNNSDIVKEISEDIMNKGQVYTMLTNEFKIRGIGLYNTFIHLDTSLTRSKVTVWNNRSDKKKMA